VRVNYFIGTVRMSCGKIAEILTLAETSYAESTSCQNWECQAAPALPEPLAKSRLLDPRREATVSLSGPRLPAWPLLRAWRPLWASRNLGRF